MWSAISISLRIFHSFLDSKLQECQLALSSILFLHIHKHKNSCFISKVMNFPQNIPPFNPTHSYLNNH